MGCCSIELSLTNLVLLGGLIFGLKKLFGFYQKWKVQKMLEKWSVTPKDKVILHQIPRCKPLPNVSPFALKLETYLRLNKIPYEIDTVDPMGPKGKLPWISYNGTHVADSHLIIQFLNKKLGINMNNGKSDELVAAARASRIVLEDHFFWGGVQYRFMENFAGFSQLFKMPTMVKLVVAPMLRCRIKKRMDSNGMGKHTPTEIYQMTQDDLRTVATLLGKKKFLGGDEPCEDDCGVFGMIAQTVWGFPGSTFERLVHGELIVLKEYCERMKEKAWPDWEQCLDKF